MRKGNLLFSAVQGLFALFVLLFGLFFIGLHYAPHLRYHLSLFFSNPPFSFLGLGGSVAVFGLLLLIGLFSMYRGHYCHVKMGTHRSSIDLILVEQLVSHYWRQVLPHNTPSVQVLLSRGNTLEILLALPFLTKEEQLILLEREEPGLKELLRSQLGYKKEFLVTVILK